MTEILMPDWRYDELVAQDERALTDIELYAGWHFCPDWNGVLIGPGMRQMEHCFCLGIDRGDCDA